MTTILSNILEECVRTGEPVELYRDRLTREALVGRVLQRSKTVVVVEKIDGVHGPDGLAAVRICDLTRVRRGGRELQGTAVDHATSPPLDSVALLALSSALTILHKRFEHVSVYLEELDDGVCFIGEPVELDDDFLVLREFGTFESMDRSELLISMAEITRVEAGGRYEAELRRRFKAFSSESHEGT